MNVLPFGMNGGVHWQSTHSSVATFCHNPWQENHQSTNTRIQYQKSFFLKEINTFIYNFSQLPHRLKKSGLVLQLRILKFTAQKCPYKRAKWGSYFVILRRHMLTYTTKTKKKLRSKKTIYILKLNINQMRLCTI